jgi:arylsulfatase A-like enzyme
MRSGQAPLRLLLITALVLGVDAASAQRSASVPSSRPPNIILVYADDLGYADVASFSEAPAAARPKTPHLDRLAREGIRLTSFYVAQAVCSASRAALLTGTYPNRLGMTGALDHTATRGLSAAETTIAELLKQRDYATAIYGKWHLGHHKPFLPTRHGFDEYFGLPYSNDMWPRHPESKGYYPELPLIDGEEVIRLDPDQAQLTRTYTDRQLLDTLRRLELDEQTLFIFTSDNGPWLSYGNHAGLASPLREGKQTTFEGGVRVPFIARWPGRIASGGVQHEMAMNIDLLPTFSALAGAGAPPLPIDGRNIWPLLGHPRDATTPHDALYFYWNNQLHAVRSGRWKLHLPHPYQTVQTPGRDGMPGKLVRQELELSLFDLETDPGETTNLAGKHPDVVTQLMVFVERARDDLGDALTTRTGTNLRLPGQIPR